MQTVEPAKVEHSRRKAVDVVVLAQHRKQTEYAARQTVEDDLDDVANAHVHGQLEKKTARHSLLGHNAFHRGDLL